MNCPRCGSYATDSGICSKLRCVLGVSDTAKPYVKEPEYPSEEWRQFIIDVARRRRLHDEFKRLAVEADGED